jgi:3D (Asp-Asp-Asp) domain-containing protein
MQGIIWRSPRRKLAVLLVAVAGFVLAYEARMFDSAGAVWQSIAGRDMPEPGAQLSFQATAYCKGTTTAAGVGVRSGIAAADPSLLPVGSVVNIGTGDSRYDGVYTVMDTGPRVRGRMLDLYIWSCFEALDFGRRIVDVTVLRLGWNPTATAPGVVDRLFRRQVRPVPGPQGPPPAGVFPDGAAPESEAEPEVEEALDAALDPDETEPGSR